MRTVYDVSSEQAEASVEKLILNLESRKLVRRS